MRWAIVLDPYNTTACPPVDPMVGYPPVADQTTSDQQRDNDKAAEFVKCICDGTKASDEVIGADVMRVSIETCLGCPGTPNVIKDNLGVSLIPSSLLVDLEHASKEP